MLSACRVVVAVGQAEHQACALAPIGGAVVARAGRHEPAQQLRRALVNEASRLHQLDRLLDRLLVRRLLRLARLRIDGVQVQRHELQLAVDAPREDLPQSLELLRLRAVRQVAARGFIRIHVLEQPLADLQLVDPVHDRRHLLAMRRTRCVEHEALAVGALPIDHGAGHIDLSAG